MKSTPSVLKTRPQFWACAATLAFSLIGVSALGVGNYQAAADRAALNSSAVAELDAFPVIEPTYRWGFAIDTFNVQEATVKPNQFFGEILSAAGMSYRDIEQLVNNAKPIFNVKQFREGKSYTLLTPKGSDKAAYFIYEPSIYRYYVFELGDALSMTQVEHPIETKEEYAEGVIESSLWNTMVDNDMSYELAAKMEDALQWSVDFYHLNKGDQFRLVYDQQYIEGEKAGVGMVKAAYYKSGPSEYYAIYHDEGKHYGYYDLDGRPMNSGFLRAPVKYSRISSRFNKNRFHPILKRRKAHLGTDYAAPYGTPILAVANGVVTKASRTRGNGNFVKIKHDATYQTQYLHMQKFAPGITPGVQVKQGQTIGYVGSTGLATGPHVCFRFWQNGKQVNHLALNFPPPEPLPTPQLPGFFRTRDAMLARLDLQPTLSSPAIDTTVQVVPGQPVVAPARPVISQVAD